jgi:hypothetical protein
MNKINIWLFLLVLLTAASCKDPFDMELRSSDKSLLVVDGFLNKGAVSRFQLSRSIPLTDRAQLKPELRAVLTVEGKDNTTAAFTERSNGVYEANLVNLEVGKDYRLRIRTADGKEYLSDYVTVKNNPPIDDVTWREEDNGVRIYTSTHDPSNNTLYYRWDFEETWEIHSYFTSHYKHIGGGVVVERDMATEDISVCWKTAPSTTIVLASSAQLNADVIKDAPVTHIERRNEKLAHRYSILMKQYALSKEAYEYLQIMKKNTESIGTIFDPQPSEVTGNIRSVSDPEEQVVGFVYATSVQQKRMFISSRDLTGNGFMMSCLTIEVPNNRSELLSAFTSGYVPYEAKTHPLNPLIITDYYASTAYCVDCTSRGGTTVRPSFW